MLSVPLMPLAALDRVAGVALVGGSLRIWKFSSGSEPPIKAAGIAYPKLSFWPAEQQAGPPLSVVTSTGAYSGMDVWFVSLFIIRGAAPTIAFAVPNCAIAVTVMFTVWMPKAWNM